MMDFLSGILADGRTVGLLAGALVILAAYAWVRFRAAISRPRHLMNKAADLLAKIDSPDQMYETGDAVRTEIATRFATATDLADCWQAYSRSLFIEDKAIVSLRAPEEFFHVRAVLKSSPAEFYRAVPNYLVGLGLVFTFLGIAVVIYQASAGLSHGPDTQILNRLLTAASLKFWTSLVAVALSIACSASFRDLTSSLSTAAAKFCRELNRCVQVITLEQSARESVLLQRRQLSEYADFFQRVTAIHEETFSKLVEESTEALHKALDEALSDVSGAFEGIATRLEEFHADLTCTRREFQTLSGQISSAGQNFTVTLADASARFSGNLEAAVNSSDQIQAHLAVAAERSREAENALTALPEMSAQLAPALADLAKLNGVAAALSSASDAIRSAAVEFTAGWERESRHIENVDRELARTLALLPRVFDEYADALQGFTSEIDGHLAEALKAIASHVGALGHGQLELRQIVERLVTVVVALPESAALELAPDVTPRL